MTYPGWEEDMEKFERLMDIADAVEKCMINGKIPLYELSATMAMPYADLMNAMVAAKSFYLCPDLINISRSDVEVGGKYTIPDDAYFLGSGNTLYHNGDIIETPQEMESAGWKIHQFSEMFTPGKPVLKLMGRSYQFTSDDKILVYSVTDHDLALKEIEVSDTAKQIADVSWSIGEFITKQMPDTCSLRLVPVNHCETSCIVMVWHRMGGFAAFSLACYSDIVHIMRTAMEVDIRVRIGYQDPVMMGQVQKYLSQTIRELQEKCLA
jgi:hypothetical protein